MTREAILARTLLELSDTLVDDFDLVELLTTLTSRCVEVLDVADAGIMLGAHGKLHMVASSSETLRLLELFEEQHEEGPCPDTYRSGVAVINLDLADATAKWPRFAPRAVAAGFRSAHAIPMRLRDQTIGALNLLRTDEGQMDGADVAIAQAFADAATIGILQHRASEQADILNDQLQGALKSRIVIEQAKGVIAESVNVNMNEAFRVLRRHSRNNNLRLTDVAGAIVERVLDAADLGALAADVDQIDPDPTGSLPGGVPGGSGTRGGDGDARDRIANERDARAEDHDQASEARDDQADVRDGRAEVRERAADVADSGAAADRTGALRDRRGAAADRTHAADDRQSSSSDRAFSARERAVSGVDELTGAYRREAGIVELERDLARARRSGLPFTLAFLDIDNFKEVNDAFGHVAGDQLLRYTGHLISGYLRPYDLLVRFGGDEFICGLPGMTRAQAAARLARVNVDLGTDRQASVSVGLSEFEPDDTLEDLVRRADEAMYRSRSVARPGWGPTPGGPDDG